MNLVKSLPVVAALLLFTALPVASETQYGKPLRGGQIVGVAQSDGADPPFDQHLKRELDKLLPQLQQLNSDATILIEAFYPGKKGKSKTEQIRNAFSLAEQVHQYLKVKNALERDYVVAIWDDEEGGDKYPKIRISTYAKNYFEN